MTTGAEMVKRSSTYLRGYRAGFRSNPHPWRWAKLWTLLAFVFFGLALGVTWTAVDLALRNTSIGEVAQKTTISRVSAWLKVYGPTRQGNGR